MEEMMRMVCKRWRKTLASRGWFGLAALLILVGNLGCARTQKATPPPAAPARTPVQVLTPPPPAPPKAEQLVKQAEEEARWEEQGLEHLASRLQRLPPSRRSLPKGEPIYPIDLNLKNADLVETIRVLGDTLGINYNIDPQVKGVVNVRAAGKLSKSELIGILETILSLNNATLIKSGELFSIVPLEKAAGRGMPVHSRGPVPPGMHAQVVFLEQTSAKEVVQVLKPLLSPGGSIGQGAHNSLVLVDKSENLDKLLGLIRLMDSRALADTSVRLVKVHHTDPGEIIKEVETIFSAYGNLAEKGKGGFGVSFLPVSRLNSVMILASSRALAERALYWVRQLDVKTDLLANVHVYHVKNYKARNLADILTQVYGGAPPAPKIKETEAKTADPSAGSRGGTGLGLEAGIPGQTQAGMGAGLGGTGGLTPSGQLGEGLAAPGSDAAQAAPLKERAVERGVTPGTSPKEGVRIIPDEENNLLVVVAPPHEWNVISRILNQLDIMPRQVLNEVLIAEIRLSKELKYGLEFLLGGVPSRVQAATGTQPGTNVPSGVLVTGQTQAGGSTTVPGTLAGVDISGPASAAFSAAGGLTFVALDTANKLRSLINLLSAEGRVNILASPHIMAANNQEARIMIGEEVPVLTSQSVPLISQATSFQTSTVQYRKTGIILSVKPQINAKGLVTLEITQEVSDARATNTGVSGSPTFSVRQAKTSLITADNQTVVLGGLIREDNSRSQAGIPGLRKMPLMGPLFGSDAVSKQKTELIVLITPHIITSLEEGARITRTMTDKVGLEETTPPRRSPGSSGPPAPERR